MTHRDVATIIPLAAKWQHFNERRRNWGLRRALFWEVMRAARIVFGLRLHYVTVGADVVRPKQHVRPDIAPQYDTRVVGFEDLLPYVNDVPDLSEAFLRSAFERDDECAANFINGELVGFGFICRTRARASEQIDVLIPEGFRYSYKDWTHPDHRRKNLSRMRGHVRFTQMPRPFKERSITYVEINNYASLLHGYRHPRERSLRMGVGGWISIFGYHVPINSRRMKWVGFEFMRRDDDGRRQYH